MEQVNVTPLNDALQDIAAVEVAKPDLTPEEWDVVAKAKDYIKAIVRPEVRSELEAVYVKDKEEFIETLRKSNEQLISERLEEWKKSQTPLEKDEISKLLSKEYIEFPVEIRQRNSDGTFTLRKFQIVELPMESEDKFVKIFQSTLVKFLEKINANDWKLDGSIAERLQGILDNFPEVMRVAVELAAVSLNPWGESDVDVTWVRRNMSSFRIAALIVLQMEANKYRDFFSYGFRLSRSRN